MLVLFALLSLVLLGFLGLAIDGGYYFAASRAVSIAADTAARAAAAEVRLAQNYASLSGYYGRATSDGIAIGQANLAGMSLTGVTFDIAYNDAPLAPPGGGGWYAGPPTSATRSVKATARGTYPTLFLRAVGVPALDIQRLGQGAPLQPVVTIERVLPLGQCNVLRGLLPAGPLTIYSNAPVPSLCSLLWNGLVDLDGTAGAGNTCNVYAAWVGPPVSGPGPAVGSSVRLESQRCGALDSRFRNDLDGTQQTIVVVDTANGNRVLGCQRVQLTVVSLAGLVLVTASPVGGMGQCALRQSS